VAVTFVSQPEEKSLSGFDAEDAGGEEPAASYNVAPQTFRPVVRLNREPGCRNSPLGLGLDSLMVNDRLFHDQCQGRDGGQRPRPFVRRSSAAEQMVAWKVDRAVGNVRNDAAHLLDAAASKGCTGLDL
jgi:hypothetical protein